MALGIFKLRRGNHSPDAVKHDAHAHTNDGYSPDAVKHQPYVPLCSKNSGNSGNTTAQPSDNDSGNALLSFHLLQPPPLNVKVSNPASATTTLITPFPPPYNHQFPRTGHHRLESPRELGSRERRRRRRARRR
ncbi:hypothetical protein L208DRAFT_895101 [Tricholoma matsutake]|nr:hypothetical protein L208DRAFT_895101 [Tricholoma matsutake 945]